MENKTKLIMGIIAMLILSACGGGSQQTTATYLGGTQGIEANFNTNAPPKEAFDGGNFPFSVEVKLQNKGETLIPKDKAKVTISGIRGLEFNQQQEALTKTLPDDMIQRRLDSSGNTIEPAPVIVEFQNLNHVGYITGNSQDYPLTAEVCYLYSTEASSSLCVRKNLINPEAGGLCEINSDRPLSVSGAPVQIYSVKEFQKGKNSVGFSFDIKHASVGKIFAKDAWCDGGTATENRAFVRVKTGIPGLTCQGLAGDSANGIAEGVLQMPDGARTVQCSQEVPSTADYQIPFSIEAQYNYRDVVSTTITIKHSGDS